MMNSEQACVWCDSMNTHLISRGVESDYWGCDECDRTFRVVDFGDDEGGE